MEPTAPPPAEMVSDEVVPSADGGDGPDNSKKTTKRMNYQNWEIAALVFGSHAACVAKPQSTVQYRSSFLRMHYIKYAQQCLTMYGLTEGQGGTHTIERSFEVRNVIPTSGKNKSKSPGFGKYQEIVSEVANNILPLYRKQLDAGGKIPSGKQAADVLQATKLAYYDSRFAVQSTTGKMPKDMPPAWTDHAWGCFVLFGLLGKKYA